jgi:hypothetical protein
LVWQIGKGRQRRLTRGQKAVFALAGGLAVALSLYVFGGAYLKDRNEALALAREWTIEGPPCPGLTREAFEAKGFKAPKSLDYSGITVSRQFGHVNCSYLRYGEGWGLGTYVVCQFTSPNVLRVETAKGEWYFAPGMGQPATISTPHDEARCVMASKFTLNG